MSGPSFDLPSVDRLTVGTVGPVGQRTFYLQARQAEQLVTLKVEKQQVSALAQFLTGLLADLPAVGDLPDSNDLELEEPALEEWAVGTLQISYAIGVSHPLSVYVELHGNPYDVDPARLESTLRELMNLSPRGIREHLHLNRPIYAVTSAYGHFGREPDEDRGTFTWERTDLVPALRSAFGR